MKTMNCPVTKFIDSKMQRFDPLWQAQNGVGGLRSRYYDKTGVAKGKAFLYACVGRLSTRARNSSGVSPSLRRK